MDVSNLKNAYDMLLLGKISDMPASLFSPGSSGNSGSSGKSGRSGPSEKGAALCVVRYAVEYYLRWTPEDVWNRFTPSIAHKMKLDGVLQRLDMPNYAKLDMQDQFMPITYVASLLYPDIYRFDERTEIIRTYVSTFRKSFKYPPDFFVGGPGRMRAAICMNYVLSEYLGYQSVEEIYHDFSIPSKARECLKRYNLSQAARDLFCDPLELVHLSIPEEQRDDLLYWKLLLDSKLRTLEKKS